jgi:hypothetical protein
MVAVPAPASEPVSTSTSTSTSASTRTSISTSTSTSVPVPVVVLVLVPACCLADGVAPRRNNDQASNTGWPPVQHVDPDPDHHVETIAGTMIAGPQAPSHEVKFVKAKIMVMVGKVTVNGMMAADMTQAVSHKVMIGKVTVVTMVTEETIPVLGATPVAALHAQS